ncbi:hypothetical protein F5Y17DRAFT_466611 [Xylariaceae sp. FL0594]|nr:hypothetical protein F5Y17DRAFT_466611 [Xylariaceae sp. FL0594]
MERPFIQRLCRSLQMPAIAKRFSDAGVGLVAILVVQLLVIPIQITLDVHHVNLPASIVVMLFAAATMIIASSVSSRVAPFYYAYLRGPTEFLGRHLSFGFVAYFILLIRDHVNSTQELSRIAVVFVATTVLSYVASFTLALGSSYVEDRIRRPRKDVVEDLESHNKTQPSPSIAWPAPPFERQPKRISQLSSLSEDTIIKESFIQTRPFVENQTGQSIDIFLHTAPIWICLTLLVVVGLPAYLATGYMMPFEAFAFGLFWAASVQLQRSLRSSGSCLLPRFQRLRTCLLIFANPLLVTWALGTGYMVAKKHYTGKSIDVVVGEFRHYTSLSESIIHIMRDSNPNINQVLTSNLGAGDLASLLLDAGVACMGFKIYEYRSELWKHLATVSITCTALAALNVLLNILIAYGVGLEPEDAVAFASRSATVALGVPAIENLRGSTTLTSAVVIFNGVLFQMLGDWMFSLLRVNDRNHAHRGHDQMRSSKHRPKRDSIFNRTVAERGSTSHRSNKERSEDGAVVAAGITVGINAAAIGTAHLIERDSRATAYSALSTIMFGAATVALTALPGVLDFATSLGKMR